MAPDDARTSPRSLPEAHRDAAPRRLKIYIGHAAGVGKTYQMLEDAQALRKRGVDVVVGFVETARPGRDGQKLEGLPVIPRRRVPYKGKDLEEMDLPAILARRPEIVLVDELAHTNVPGVEHEKRFQDVEEILKRDLGDDDGQHPASRVALRRRDARHGSRRARARPRPPPAPGGLDRQRRPPFRGADPAPEGGKDLPGRTDPRRRSRTSFAARTSRRCELAMRSIADRLEADRRASGPTGNPEAIGTKVLVAISSNAATTRQLLRRGSSIAGRMNTNWFAGLRPDAGEHPQQDVRPGPPASVRERHARDGARRQGRVAERQEDVARELFAFASRNGVTLAIFGKSRRSWLRRMVFRSPIHAFARVGSGIDVFEIETSSPQRE